MLFLNINVARPAGMASKVMKYARNCVQHDILGMQSWLLNHTIFNFQTADAYRSYNGFGNSSVALTYSCKINIRNF